MDNVVQKWLVLEVEYQRFSQEVIGISVGRYMGLFYADDDIVGSRYL